MTDVAISSSSIVGPPTPAAAGLLEAIPPRRLIAFLTMCFGMFMAFLDIQIVSSSLNEIQAGISASADEIPWVQTAYLIAEVIAIPLSGFLSRALGTRILFSIFNSRINAGTISASYLSLRRAGIFGSGSRGFAGAAAAAS